MLPMADDEEDDGSRLMVECDDCGTAYAAVETDDGRTLPIGSKGSCDCGGTDFSRLSSDELLSDADSDEAAGDT